MNIEDFNSADTVLYEKLMRIQEHITDTIKEYGSISQFKEDVLYVMKCLLERQLNSAELTATETLLKNMEYNIQKQKEEKYEEYIAVLKTEAEKKDKVINEMVEQLVGLSIYDEKEVIVIFKNEEEVKEYFTNKVEREGK